MRLMTTFRLPGYGSPAVAPGKQG